MANQETCLSLQWPETELPYNGDFVCVAEKLHDEYYS